MKYVITPEDAHKAKHPHEVFLINLIFNHILLFVAAISASSLQFLVLIVPVLSFLMLVYLLWRGKRSQTRDPWFIMCHWQVAARRSRLFLVLLGVMALVIVLLWVASGGDPTPQHYALGGAVALPTMIAVLVLIMMESDAMHQAGNGRMPKWVAEKYPNPEAAVVDEDA